jgi:hypothetical protein
MGIQESPDRADVDSASYTSGVVAVGATETEAKAGGARNPLRQEVVLHNDSNATVFYGPTGVTTTGATKGIPLRPRQEVFLPLGDVGVFLIADTAGNNVIVQEMG